MSLRTLSGDPAVRDDQHYTSSSSPYLQTVNELQFPPPPGQQAMPPSPTRQDQTQPILSAAAAPGSVPMPMPQVQFPKLPTPPLHQRTASEGYGILTAATGGSSGVDSIRETKRRSRTMSLSEQTRAAAQKMAPPISYTLVSLCLLWYLMSAISSNLTKAILSDFDYPVCLTLAQFVYAFLFGTAMVAAAQRIPGLAETFPKGTVSTQGLVRPSRFVALCTAPMAAFQIVGHILSHSATSAIPVSLVHAIKSLSPLFTVVAYAVLFGVKYNKSTWIALAPLTIGVMLTCAAEFKARPLAILNAVLAALVFVSQNMYSKGLLTTGSPASRSAAAQASAANQTKLDKLTILYWCAAFGFIGTLPIWLLVDGPKVARRGLLISGDASPSYIFMLYTLNGFTHFAQNLLSFMILGNISPVAYSIASLLKRIVVISVAIVWFGQRVSSSQGWGIVMTFIGLYIYDRFGSKTPPIEQRKTYLPS